MASAARARVPSPPCSESLALHSASVLLEELADLLEAASGHLTRDAPRGRLLRQCDELLDHVCLLQALGRAGRHERYCSLDPNTTQPAH